MKWRGKQSIIEPFRIMALFTMPPINYRDYNRLPTRKGGHAVTIEFVGDKSKTVRHYFEFFITPEGTFAVPEPLIPTSTKIADTPIFAYPLSDKYTLLARRLPFSDDHDLNTWHPDKEICIYTADKAYSQPLG